MGILASVGALQDSLPGWGPECASKEERAESVEILGRCLGPGAPAQDAPVALGLAVLLDPAGVAEEEVLLERLVSLKTSKELRTSILTIRRTRKRLVELVGQTLPQAAIDRGGWVKLAREPFFGAGAALALASDPAAEAGLRETIETLRTLSKEAPVDPVALTAKDAMGVGLGPGPALGEVLRRAALASLGGAFPDRDAALAWLAEEVAGR